MIVMMKIMIDSCDDDDDDVDNFPGTGLFELFCLWKISVVFVM